MIDFETLRDNRNPDFPMAHETAEQYAERREWYRQIDAFVDIAFDRLIERLERGK